MTNDNSDKNANPEPLFQQTLNGQNTNLYTGRKKPKGKNLSKLEKYHNRLISKFRRPSRRASLIGAGEKTNTQKAGKVRSADGLLLHCWGKLAFAFHLLVFNY